VGVRVMRTEHGLVDDQGFLFELDHYANFTCNRRTRGFDGEEIDPPVREMREELQRREMRMVVVNNRDHAGQRVCFRTWGLTGVVLDAEAHALLQEADRLSEDFVSFVDPNTGRLYRVSGTLELL